ncbi:MAG: tetratricopeptide repeat protein [Candidatus Kapaibacteriota bacterium]
MDETISPLFVVQAEKELNSGNPLKSIELCKRGLQFFPDFPIGYILLAEAYEKINDFESSNQVLNEALTKFPNNAAIKSALNRREETGSILVQEKMDNSEIEVSDDSVYKEEIILIEELEELEEQFENELEEELIEEIDEELLSITSSINEIETTTELTNNDEINVNFQNELFEDNFSESEKHHKKTSKAFKIQSNFAIDLNLLNSQDLDLIPGINFLPFRFNSYNLSDYKEVKEAQISKILSFNLSPKTDIIPKETYFESIVNTISNSSQEECDDYDDLNYPEELISDEILPTETYAMILEKQNKNSQAIEVYQKLISIKPEKADEYLEKIRNLQNV